MNTVISRWIPLVLITISTSASFGQSNAPFVAKKKLVQFGWDTPTAQYVKANIAAMEAQPFAFDGITFYPGNTNGFVSLFETTKWDDTRLNWKALTGIRWKKFTDNFLILNATDPGLVSYWNDTQWENIVANMKQVARAAKISGCKGIFFDTEHYDTSAWSFSRKTEGHTEAQLYDKMRARGAQVMQAWQSEFPDIKIWAAVLLYGAYLSDSNYAMEPAFVNGLLDALNTRAMLIEGHEYAYYWSSSGEWFSIGYHNARITYRDTFIKPENRAKYDRQVQVGTATYPNKFADGDLSQAQNDRHEHHVYMGLATTDEYQFYFQERFAFWDHSDNPIGQPISSQTPWSGIAAGIASAKDKYNSGKKLEFDLSNGVKQTQVSVTITSPVNETVLTPSKRFAVTALADGAAKVEFYRNAAKVSEDTTPPFELQETNLPGGTYTYIARAFNSQNNEWGSSNPIHVTVSPIVEKNRGIQGLP